MPPLRNRLRAIHPELRPWRRQELNFINWKLVLWVSVGITLAYSAVIIPGGIKLYRGERNKLTNLAERWANFPALTVNGDSISVRRIRFEAAARYHYVQEKKISISEQDTYTAVIEQQVNRLLYRQELARRNLLPTTADVDREMDALFVQAACLRDDGTQLSSDTACKGDVATGKERLSRFLTEQYGDQVTLDDFRRWTSEALLESTIQQKVLAQASVRHILIAIPENASDAVVEQKRQLALSIKAKITNPSQFADIAKQYSEDVASRDTGGSLGVTTRGSDAPVYSGDFEELIFSIPVGQISDPVRSPYGWHIVLVDSREGSENMSLRQFTQKLRDQSKVTIYLHPPQ